MGRSTPDREPLLRLTAADFAFTATRGSGAGGQHRNTRDTAIRCVHPPSGAVGTAQDERSQLQNKRLAFQRCTATPEFTNWLKVETARRTGEAAAREADINRRVDHAMRPENLIVEIGDGEHWQPEPENPTT